MTTETRNTSSTDYYADRALRRAARVQYRAERRAARYAGSGAFVGGVALIAFGVIILLQNMGVVQLQNWWALFILLPAFGSFTAAYGAYRTNGGHMNAMVRGSFIGELLITAVAMVFLFGLNISLFLPVVLIVAGLGLLFNTVLPD